MSTFFPRVQPSEDSQINLAEALFAFEKALGQEWKETPEVQVQEILKQGIVTDTPVVSDILRLAYNLRRHSTQQGTPYVPGPGLLNLSRIVYQFADLACHCGITRQSDVGKRLWRALETSLYEALPFDQYLLFYEDIGQIFLYDPTVELLAPSSPRLRWLLYDYHTVLVRLFMSAVSITRTKTAPASVPGIYDDHRKYLLNLARHIRTETRIAQVNRVKALQCKPSQISALLQSRFSTRRIRIATATFLDSCSTYNHLVTFRRARKLRTTALLHSGYPDWKTTDLYRNLFLSGPPGSGKTTQAANIVEDLVSSVPGAKVVYHFCRYDEAASVESKTVIGNLTRQVFELEKESLQSIAPHSILSMDEIMTLQQLLMLHQSYYFVIDGLDECDRQNAILIMEHIVNPQALNHRLKIFLSARPLAMEWTRELLSSTCCYYDLSRPSAVTEILVAEYAKNSLEQCARSGTLVLRSLGLASRILQALIKGAGGLFLSVDFQIELICSLGTSQADIIEALNKQPRGLSELLGEIYRLIQRQTKWDPVTYGRLFELLCAARRPLTIDEICYFLKMDNDDETFQRSRTRIYNIVEHCRCFLMVDEQGSTVRFTHRCAREFFVSRSKLKPFDTYVNLATAQMTLGYSCVTALSVDKSDASGVNSRLSISIIESQPPSGLTLMTSHEQSNPIEGHTRLALPVDNSKQHVGFTYRTGTAMSKETISYSSVLRYATEYWLHHTDNLSPGDSKMYSMWCKLIEQQEFSLELTQNNSAPYRSGGPSLANIDSIDELMFKWAIDHDHFTMIYWILSCLVSRERQPCELRHVIKLIQTLFRCGKHDLVDRLLRSWPEDLETKARLFLPVMVSGNYNLLSMLCQERLPDRANTYTLGTTQY